MISNAPKYFSEIAVSVLKCGTSLSFRARGESMNPFICGDSIVTIDACPKRLYIGDVVLFSSAGRLKLHRIIKKIEGGYITRGDAARQHDGMVSHEHVIGRAVYVKGSPDFHLKRPFGMVIAYLLGIRRYPLLFRFISMLLSHIYRLILKLYGGRYSMPLPIDRAHDR